jgi:hypothetical protein
LPPKPPAPFIAATGCFCGIPNISAAHTTTHCWNRTLRASFRKGQQKYLIHRMQNYCWRSGAGGGRHWRKRWRS